MNNSVTLIGHVGQKPTALKFAASGKELVKFSLAIKEYSASDAERTLWVDVEAWGDMGKRVLATITKGREVVVQGRLSMTRYSKSEEGKSIDVTKPVIKLVGFHLCGRKPETKEGAGVESPTQKETAQKSEEAAAA